MGKVVIEGIPFVEYGEGGFWQLCVGSTIIAANWTTWPGPQGRLAELLRKSDNGNKEVTIILDGEEVEDE